MKRAKLMLTCIAVLAVVGGALAFNAKGKGKVYCKISTTVCDLAPIDYTYLQPNPITATTTNPCPQTGAFSTFFYTEAACNTSFTETQSTVWETDL